MVGAALLRPRVLAPRYSEEPVDPTPLRITCSLLMLGATSFGRSAAPNIIKEFVDRRGWMTADEFAEGYALAKLLPGPTAGNIVVYLVQSQGYGLAATLGLLPYAAPGAAVMIAASVFLLGHAWPVWFQGALLGASAAVIGLFAAALWQMLPSARKARLWLPVAAASFAANAGLHLNILIVLLACGGASVWLNRGRA
jgi:chromate transporter